MLSGLYSKFTGRAEATKDDEELEAKVAEPLAQSATKAPGIKVYEMHGTTWEKLTSCANAEMFYDANEDNSKKPEWHLEIEAADVDTPVNVDLNFTAREDDLSFRFTAHKRVLAIKFPSWDAYDAFLSALNSKQFENTFGVADNAKNREKALGKDFATTMFATGDEEDMEVEQEEAAEEGFVSAEEEDVGELQERKAVLAAGDPIRGVIMGALENSYVLRGSSIEALRNTVGGLEEKDVVFNVTPVKGGPAFTPSKVVMANAERYMNMITPTKPSSLFQHDVEYGKVVSEWSFQKDTVDIPIKDIATDHKSAQLEETSTFLGLDNNRLCRWDLRTADGVVDANTTPVAQYEDGKDYARGTNFSCMATSGEGCVVVGSDDGRVRLYSNRLLTRAVTSLPGLGAPVTAVDVTFNGEWVLATTNNYLLLIHAIFKGKGGVEMNGFKKSIGKSAPKPVMLKLKPQDHQRTNYKPLDKAKFTWVTEDGKQERLIVASCGSYTVLWDFAKVKKAQSGGVVGVAGLPACLEYKLVAKEENVVESAFMHDKYSVNGVDSMVIVTEHDVYSMA